MRGTLVTSDDNYVVASLSDMGRLENGIPVIDLADIIPKYRVQEKEKQKDGQWYQDVEIFAGGATHSIGNIINEDGLVRLSMDGKSKVVAVLDASLFQDLGVGAENTVQYWWSCSQCAQRILTTVFYEILREKYMQDACCSADCFQFVIRNLKNPQTALWVPGEFSKMSCNSWVPVYESF